MTLTPPDWSGSNLRRRSFRGQTLSGANFQGADLRGCDFRDADLTGANLSQAQIGSAPESLLWGSLLLVGTGVVALQMLSQLIFGILGLTPTDPNYGLRWAFLASVASVGAVIGLATLGSTRLLVLAAVLEGALVGFFVGGWIADLRVDWAVYGSVLGAIALGMGQTWARSYGVGVVVVTLGVAISNAMFFLAGVTALNLLSVHHWLAGGGWMLLTVLYGLITLRALGFLYGELRHLGVTSFARANLSQVRWH